MDHISNLIPAIELEKRELAKLESKKLVTGEEKQFAKIIKAPQIVQRPIEELIEVLRLVMIKVGLREQNWPHEIEKAVLLEHIVNSYGGHTHEEIKLAFEMAVNGKLEFPEKEDAKHYENFSCEYFSRIMNAYRRWAIQTYQSVIKNNDPLTESKKELPPIIPAIDWQHYWDDTKKFVKSNYAKFYLVDSDLYDWAEKEKKISLTKEEKREYMDRSILVRHINLVKAYESNPHDLFSKQDLLDFNTMRANGEYSKKEYDRLTIDAKKMAIFDILKKEDE